MANANASIEELTASLQELAQSYSHCTTPADAEVLVAELHISKEVETFIEDTQAYAEKTRHISEGTY